MKRAWIVSVDMGYGHQRAAYPFRNIACERIITANGDKVVGPDERQLWERFQSLYEGISRVRSIPLIGPVLWNAYDHLQGISPYYPFRDLSKPTFGVLHLNGLLKKGFARSAAEYALRKKTDIPFLTTFFAVALAADRAGIRDVYCVVTDSDINRIWAAKNPAKCRVNYLTPGERSAKRLAQYGVPPERIFTTGFPLPEENVTAAASDLARRIAVLDPGGRFRAKYDRLIDGEIGPVGSAARPLTITYAVGGAGAQADVARKILSSFSGKLREGAAIINLIAGTRLDVDAYFRKTIAELGLENELGKSVRILCGMSKMEYFEQFNELLRETDVLWTKPSELTFYSALGLPIVMTEPLGAHEVCNRDLLVKIGGGHMQEDPCVASEWISDWVGNGLLALTAFNGYQHAPRNGTENIKRILFAGES